MASKTKLKRKLKAARSERDRLAADAAYWQESAGRWRTALIEARSEAAGVPASEELAGAAVQLAALGADALGQAGEAVLDAVQEIAGILAGQDEGPPS